MEYQTRHLVARQEMTHDGQDVRPGDKFVATPVDADYLVRRGHAIEAPPVKDAAPAPAQIKREETADQARSEKQAEMTLAATETPTTDLALGAAALVEDAPAPAPAAAKTAPTKTVAAKTAATSHRGGTRGRSTAKTS